MGDVADNRNVSGGRDVGLGDGASMAHDGNHTIFAHLRDDPRATFPPLRDIGFSQGIGGFIRWDDARLDGLPA